MSLTDLVNRALGRKPPAKQGQWRFSDLQEKYLDRLSRWPAKAVPAPSGARVGVVVTPWLFTPVPFFSLECALMLAGRGAQVTLLWDASNVFLNAAKQSEVDAVRAVVAQLESRLRVLDVSAAEPAPEVRLDFIEPLLYENAVKQMRGESAAREFLESHPECVREMKTHAGRIHALLAGKKFDWLLVPGGVWAASGLYAQIARDLDVPFTAFDSGVGSLYVAHGGPAAHFADIPQAFAQVVAGADAGERADMIAQAWTQLQIRREGRDPFRLQPASADSESRAGSYDIVVPLNYRSDTAALFRQRLFSSVTDWLTQLLDWVATQPGVRVVIRQHPCERIPEYRGSDAWAEVLAPYRSLGPRMRFVAAEEAINTYDLIDGASVVLPFTSRIGIEAAMLGKAVLLGTHCYYQDCGFARNPATVPEYFAQIGEALRGRLAPSAAEQESAAIVYYLAECCLPLTTHFTPQPPDYLEWAAIAPDDLWASPAGEDFAEALLTRKSVASVQHRRRLGNHGAPRASSLAR
jgi:hypothetical protein